MVIVQDLGDVSIYLLILRKTEFFLGNKYRIVTEFVKTVRQEDNCCIEQYRWVNE